MFVWLIFAEASNVISFGCAKFSAKILPVTLCGGSRYRRGGLLQALSRLEHAGLGDTTTAARIRELQQFYRETTDDTPLFVVDDKEVAVAGGAEGDDAVDLFIQMMLLTMDPGRPGEY